MEFSQFFKDPEQVTAWMINRFSGTDPLFDLCPEEPHRLIVTLLDGAKEKMQPRVITILGESILSLLKEGRNQLPCVPQFLKDGLTVCQERKIPATRDFFEQELASAAVQPERFLVRWGNLDDGKRVISAAALQIPAAEGFMKRPRGFWEDLLKQPDYATLALFGLGSQFSEQLPYLTRWWEACGSTKDLSCLISISVAKTGFEHTLNLLHNFGKAWPKDLKAAVNQIALQRGMGSIFA